MQDTMHMRMMKASLWSSKKSIVERKDATTDSGKTGSHTRSNSGSDETCCLINSISESNAGTGTSSDSESESETSLDGAGLSRAGLRRK